MAQMEIPTRFVDKARFVRAIFTDVEKEYDVLLHLMTLSFDWVWRRRMFAKMDLACGTGLVTFELSRAIRDGGLIVGLDLTPAMLSIANRKKPYFTGNVRSIL